ncbi:MAG TPA: MBOAT family O-acyltransferase [Anaerolineales bacterium]|nr:MBOAT family O-acyltransferase [Anaerolineales bacterium]
MSVAIYYLLDLRLQNIWLLFVSYIFIFSWDWTFAVVLALLTLINFLLALRLRIDDRGQRGLLWLGIGLNVSVWVFFRTAQFFLPELEEFIAALGLSTRAGGLEILVPLGLSYYTLQTISYLVDVYRGQLDAESDWVNFSLYLAYFPKLLAGPIERARTFLPKLTTPRLVNNRVLAQSMVLIFTGLTRKLIIADSLMASFRPGVFEYPAKYTPPELLIWLVFYAFTLYNDFAGYTDIVRGISGFFGITLSANFRAPYFSRNFTEFWKRWHITLSEWLRDYIYFPVSRELSHVRASYRKLANLILPPMITMLISGFWHGFNVNMLIWGGLHGTYLIVERFSTLWRPAVPPQNQPIWRQGAGIAVVFLLTMLAWVPFHWDLPLALQIWQGLFDWSDVAIRYRRMFLLLPLVFGSLIMDFMHYRYEDEFVFLNWPPMAKALCMAIVLFLVFIVTGGDFEQPFVYQAF